MYPWIRSQINAFPPPFFPGIYAAVDDKTPNAGFGKIFPAPCSVHEEEAEDEDDEIPSEFISKRELEKGRVSEKGDFVL